MLEDAAKRSVRVKPQIFLEVFMDSMDNRQKIFWIMVDLMDRRNVIETKEKFYLIVTETLNVSKNYAQRIVSELSKTRALDRIEKGKYLVNPYLAISSGVSEGEVRYDYNELLEEENK